VGTEPVPRRRSIFRRLALGWLVVVVLLGIAATVMVRGGSGGSGFVFGTRVAVVELRGVIQDTTESIEALERLRKDPNVVAVVLRVDSPGGAVAPSQELYDQVWRLREQKPVIASLGNVAASGGYYVASAANRIVADPGTITGSIGAVMGIPQYAPLAGKLGYSEEIVKSGRFKDAGHPLRPLAPEERALFQGMVDDVLSQFVEAVARGRGLDAARVRRLADGRIFSGRQAHEAGLVDRLGGLDAATRIAWEDAGQTGDPVVSRWKPRRRFWVLDALGVLLAAEPPLPFATRGLFYLYQGPLPE
jgi:protease IV